MMDSVDQILLALGGVGMFLLGMKMMTGGLQGLAGNRLRAFLARYTRSAMSGAITGSLATAVIQSSSATTVMAVGFVGAGLLTFTQALGIIFGANIGTTMTGWLVALLGFKMKLGVVALPLVFVGVMMQMFGGERLYHHGKALAGFSLLFIGLDALQAGLSTFQGAVTPTDFPDNSLFGRLQLVLIGVVITLVTQSSSAGVATALVALNAGAISFPQAAALVIGMDVGTTVTAILATLGGSLSMRRTGFAHVIYNLLTGLMAFILLGPYTDYILPMISSGAAGDAQVALVGFHSVFNGIGVLLVLPFAGPFARMIRNLFPEEQTGLGHRLDPALQRDPVEMMQALDQTLKAVTDNVEKGLATGLRAGAVDADRDVTRILVTVRQWLDQPVPGRERQVINAARRNLTNRLDHLLRLEQRLGQETRIENLAKDHRLRRLAGLLAGALSSGKNDAQYLHRLEQMMRRQRAQYGARLIATAEKHERSVDDILALLDSLRWLHRVTAHLWRIHRYREAMVQMRPLDLYEGGA